MKKSKKIIYILWMLPVLFLCLLIGSATVYAAMTVRDEKQNLFQIGNLQTTIEEIFTETTTILPDKPVEKSVSVTNTGTVDQFVRVMLQPEISVGNDEDKRVFPSKIGEEMLLDLNDTDWKLGEDGYYYYLKVLKSGKSNRTETLFTQVKLKNGLGQEYDKAVASLLVKVEAIGCVKYTYRDAWWQGAIPTDGQLQLIDNQLATIAE
ncbi:alternate signal-mediated exported protein [Enterococcus moraviensis ATCC BAA-383]|uniref:Alternate signal-mediated exported protein n=1 Tax=Enterococcus moraviensis ATCC BAA-383 TaxID=1158609 RepID=R2TXI0_9ENTE|nr:hypothetical protein [Enterococcus moraviensis]EOI05052.1 alternate signal-mediated exported protein [Enterococcus moraviensis ATCC BAA-383]EOT63835.1 hypothetical protein I586_03268 [Enterococcus moraviensis ATCC BAA-383]